jgi:hypothetical protein
MNFPFALSLVGLFFPVLAWAQPATDPTPADWARFRAMQQADESGQVQPDGLLRALEKRREILSRSKAPVAPATASGTSSATPFTTGPSPTAAPPGAGIAPLGWTALGPTNVGGRIRSIAIHPTQYNKVWVGSVSGGLWLSTNFGLGGWAPVNDFMANLAISSIVISPSNTNVMYAGTGEGFFNADAVRGAGVFKSTDGGVTWSALASTNPQSNHAWYYVNRLAVHPTNGDILLAATNNGVYRSADGGASWSLRTAGNLRYTDVDFDPTDGNRALIAPGSFGGGPVSFSFDMGMSWHPSDLPPMSRVEIAYSVASGLAYASVDTNAPGTFNATGSLYRTVNAGINWTLVSTPLHLGTQGAYSNAIWVDPTNPGHLVVGGIHLYQSFNGGSNWNQISNATVPYAPQAGQHAIVSVPFYNNNNNPVVFVANNSGIYRADNINAASAMGVAWQNVTFGLSITQFVSGAGHGGTNGHIVGGTQGNGSLVYSGSGTGWGVVQAGDAGFSAIDPADGNIIYGEGPRLQLHRSTNASGPPVAIHTGILDAGTTANLVAPFILDPNNPGTMIAGGRSVWRSTSVTTPAPGWSAILGATGDGSPATYASRLAIAQGNSNLIWVGKNNGTLWKTTNGTAAVPTWSPKGSGITPARMVLSILIDKNANNTVYVGFGGYSNQNLWRTTDGGTTWDNIGAGLPPSPVRAIERYPALPNNLYVGTDVGIFTSEDGGATWSTSNDGPANVSVDHLFWYDATTLVAATHGRGMFTAQVAPTAYTLTVSKVGSGSGPVTSSPAGIACGSMCGGTFPPGTSVTLTASPNSGSIFGGWSGACSGMANTCTVSMDAAKSVVATFHLAHALSVGKAGAGSGPVTSVPAGISCGSSCTALFASGSAVTLTAAPNPGSVFAGWSGACSGMTTCVVTMSAARSVTATFNVGQILTVAKSGSGSGPVSSSPAGISCGSVCSRTFPTDSVVTLTATPSAGSTFVGWSGACTGTGNCVVTMSAARNVTAAFNGPPVTYNGLVVGKAGTGSGPVTSSPAGISCGSACNASFASGTDVMLTATPNAGSIFAGWSGACAGTATTCLVDMSAPRRVTATFSLGYVLTVNKAGNSAGPVSSSPSGITCGSVCSAGFAPGTSVTLTANPDFQTVFAGWSGACSGTSLTCVVTMNAAKSVTATFNHVVLTGTQPTR